jgi:hypothetical protein
MIEVFAASAITLYVGHHVGDYWVQTDHQARHKGDAGHEGRWACLMHVVSYVLTQAVLLLVMATVLGVQGGDHWATWTALIVSGVTHYMADRREHGLMFKLARLLPGKAAFLKLGVPRLEVPELAPGVPGDNPSLGTGAWALDQSWHIFWGVFVPALILGWAA